jgi:hypothetical protein
VWFIELDVDDLVYLVFEKMLTSSYLYKKKKWVITHWHLKGKTEKKEKWERYDRVRAAHADAGKGVATRSGSVIIEVWQCDYYDKEFWVSQADF